MATVLDITSIMVAYTIGMAQASVLLGLAYAIFDAILVVWMRKPISRLVRRAVNFTARESPRDVYVADLA